MNDETLLFIFPKVKLPKVLEIRFIYFFCIWQEWASIFKRIHNITAHGLAKGYFFSLPFILSFITIIKTSSAKYPEKLDDWVVNAINHNSVFSYSPFQCTQLDCSLCCAVWVSERVYCIRVEWRKVVGETTLSRDKSIKQYKNMVSVHALHTHRRGRVHLLSSCHSCSTIYLTSQKDK